MLYLSIFVSEGFHILNYVIDVLFAVTLAILTWWQQIFPKLPVRFMMFIPRRIFCRRRVSIALPDQGRCIGIEVPEYSTLLSRKKPKVICFRGVPYAAFGGRFEAPKSMQAVAAENGVREGEDVIANPVSWHPTFEMGTPATYAPQPTRFSFDSPVMFSVLKAFGMKFFGPGHIGNETKCNQLNIWLPLNAAVAHSNVDGQPGMEVNPQLPTTPMPVMVFIHGGGLIFGTAHQRLTDGTNIARKNCIVVSINYRLGILGWGRIPGKTTNCGLRDQLEALRWVKRNIHHFGGDPNNITLSGQSGGAMSIGALMGVEALYDEELCHKFMLMSGTGHYTHSVKLANSTMKKVCVEANVPMDRISQYLTSCSLQQLIALQDRVTVSFLKNQLKNKDIEKVLPFFPVFEAGDSLLPEHPEAVVKKRIAAGKPLIPLFIGYTNAEFSLFSSLNRKHQVNMDILAPRLEKLLGMLGGHSLPDGSAPPTLVNHSNASFVGVAIRNDSDLHQIGDTNVVPAENNNSFVSVNDSFAEAGGSQPTQTTSSFSKQEAVVVGSAGGDAQDGDQASPCARKRAHQIIKAYSEGSYANQRVKTRHPVWDAIHTDWLFRLPAERIASVYADAGKIAFVYRFQHRCPIRTLDSLHILDLHYVFGTWNSPPYLTMGYTPRMAESSRQVRHDFLEFIRQPANKLSELNAKHPERWVPWNSETRPVKVYAEDETDTGCCGPNQGYCPSMSGATGRYSRAGTRSCRSTIHIECHGDAAEVESWGPTMENIPLALGDQTISPPSADD